MKYIKLTRRELLEYYMTADTQIFQDNLSRIINKVGDIGISNNNKYQLKLISDMTIVYVEII